MNLSQRFGMLVEFEVFGADGFLLCPYLIYYDSIFNKHELMLLLAILIQSADLDAES